MAISPIDNGEIGFTIRTALNEVIAYVNDVSGSSSSTFPYSGSADITGSLNVTEKITSEIFLNPQILTTNVVIPAGYNGFLVGPIDNSGSIDITSGSTLVIV